MAIEIVELTTCKFCREGAGKIYLDAHAICNLHARGDDFGGGVVDARFEGTATVAETEYINFKKTRMINSGNHGNCKD